MGKLRQLWANRWFRRVVIASALSAAGYTAAPEQIEALLMITGS